MPCHYLSLLWIYRFLCPFILSKKRLALTICYASIFLYTCELWQHPHMTSKWTQQQQRQQQQQQPASYNTKREGLSIVFFTTHFSSFLPVLLSPRKEIWKNRCCFCRCCGICEPSWLCPRSAKNKNFFFPAASSHFFPLFTNFLGVVLFVLSFVHVDGIRPLFRTTRFEWQVMWHCQPFPLVFCFHFPQICNCNEENGICCSIPPSRGVINWDNGERMDLSFFFHVILCWTRAGDILQPANKRFTNPSVIVSVTERCQAKDKTRLGAKKTKRRHVPCD